MTELTVFQRLVSMSQNDTRLNLPAATVFQHLVDTVLSDGYSVIPSVGWWNQSDFVEVIGKRTSPKWDVAWKVSDEADKTALFELEDAGYIIHVIYEIGGANVWFISLHGEKYHEVKTGMESSATLSQMETRTETFPSGAVRDTQSGKSRPDLVSPLAMDRLGHWLRLGAEKYGERNWEKGISQERCFASLYRHLLKYQDGDTTEDHLAAVFCNAMFLTHNDEAVRRGILPPTLLDLPSYQPKNCHVQS